MPPTNTESATYHEAGHVVIATALGLRISRHGIGLDSDGRAISYYEFRKPRVWSSQSSEVSTEDTIVATLAGLAAQLKFYPNSSTDGASDDEVIIDLLLEELHPNDVIGYRTCPSLSSKFASSSFRSLASRMAELAGAKANAAWEAAGVVFSRW